MTTTTILSRQAGPQTASADSPANTGTWLPTLDGWRAVAIALVLLAHGSESLRQAMPGLMPTDVEGLKHLGLLGVQFFFALSGFLITGRLLQEEARHGQISLAAFYIRRCFRILPAACFFLAVVGLLALAGVLPISPARWWSTLLFAANYSSAEHSWYLGHFWSLAVEEHFYLLWPAAFFLLRLPKGRLVLVFLLAIAVAVWRAADFKYGITGASAATFWGRTDIQADGILWGVWLALLYAHPVWKPRLHRLFANSATWPLLCLLLLALEALPAMNWKPAFALITVKAMLMPLLILGTVIHSTGRAGRLLETPLMRHTGRLSYSLYLWQQLFLVWSADRVAGLEWLQTFPLNLTAVFACATISLVLVETPLIALGHRVVKRIRRA